MNQEKKAESAVAQSCPTLCDPIGCSLPGSSVGFPRQEHWSGLPFPSPGDLPDPGSPALQADSLLWAYLVAPMVKLIKGLTLTLQIVTCN